MVYVITYRGNYLDYFSPNGLPIKTKNGFSCKDIFGFSKRSYMTFKTEKEVKEYLRYMLRELRDKHNVKRYNEVHPYADGILIDRFSKFKYKEVN